ncbi:hypothetical protein MTR_1g094240 [Medicago truncatula]|uniref:Uncharacterized protein n=1 Tax=Medicago truncatula TaxID=3880 RepID=A0A072VZL1_MEDTR|nr:hypothetical protein MTR_1g094240 [Medicago truncatula]
MLPFKVPKAFFGFKSKGGFGRGNEGDFGGRSGVEISLEKKPFVWEEVLLLSLRHNLEGMVWSQEADVWRWGLEDSGVFTVKSAYLSLEEVLLSEDRWREDEKGVFKCLWKIPAPSKVVAFGWKDGGNFATYLSSL